MDQTDKFYHWATGAKIEDAKIQFQQCIKRPEAYLFFGGGNPDLGGIGVILSLTILCITCTISTLAVLILGLIRGDHKRDTLYDQPPDPKTLFQRIAFRMNESLISALKSFLDSALYLSFTVQIATFLAWTDISVPYNDRYFNTGGFYYDLILLLYTPVITICPVLTLINSPFFRKRIRRRHFRLLIATGSIGYALYFHIAGTSFYKVDTTYYKAPNKSGWECMPEFLVAIFPAEVEAKLLHTSWAMCTAALIFTFILEWEDENFRPLLFLKFIKKGKYTVQAKKHEKNAPSDFEEKRLSKPTPHKLMLRVIWGLYLLVWIWNQFLPLYLLWRIRWMRHNIGSAVNDYIAYTAQIENRRIRVNAGEFEKWDDDKWTFGQVLSMTLWFPALLEMFYSMIAGDEVALTGTLPTPWKATKISPTESTFPVPGQSEATETVASV